MGNKCLSVLDLLELVLNGDLELQNSVIILSVLDGLENLLSLRVHGCLEERLGVVEFVLVDVREEFAELVVAIRGIAVVLDLEVRVAQEGKSSAVAGTELEL